GNTTAAPVAGLTEGATYYFVATAYDATGAESAFSADVSATVAYRVPVAQFTANPTTGNSPLSVNFSNTSTGSITSYAWTFGDGGTSTAASPSHSYAAAGGYTVSLPLTRPGSQQYADAQQLRDGDHRGTGGTVHRQSHLREFAADGELQQHVDGQHHRLSLGLRRWRDPHRRKSEPQLCGGGGVHGEAHCHRSGRQT